ncbi:hypothetical protein LCGC14_0354410 [marine sediment metagenome]|uniref:Collagen-like protein n=2 Tax=root TaxID=1 RepID=A0A0F9VX21_9ZZZZ
MKFTKQLVTLIFIASLLFACSKDDGKDGAIGPAGAQGEQGVAGSDGVDGADGVDGEDGEDGATGTANVIYSDWIDSEFDANINTTSASFTIDAPSMTQEFIDTGVILVFGKSKPNPVSFDTDVYGLPIVFGASLQQSHYFRAEAAEELDIVVAANEQGENVGVPFFGEYRYVLIPGEVEASNGIGGLGSKTATLDYTKMSYEEVTAHFGIEE